MCNPMSAVVTRTNVLWSRISDAHEDIISENGLNDKTKTLDFVRVELAPKEFDFRRPVAEWEYKTDQDFLPEWYNAEEAEKAVRAAAPAWADAHIFIDRDFDGHSNSIFAYGKSVIKNHGQTGGYCRAHDGGTVNSTGQTGGNCRAYDGGTVNSTGQTGGYCRAHDGGTVNSTGQTGGDCRAHDGGTVNSTGQTGGGCWADGGTVNSTGQTGGYCWAYDGGTVNSTGQTGGGCRAYDGGTVKKLDKK